MDFYLKTHTFDVCIWKANFDYHISIWLYVNVLLRKYFIFNSLKNVHDNLYSQACNLYRSSKFPAGLGHLGLPTFVLSKHRIIPNRSLTASKIAPTTSFIVLVSVQNNPTARRDYSNYVNKNVRTSISSNLHAILEIFDTSFSFVNFHHLLGKILIDLSHILSA